MIFFIAWIVVFCIMFVTWIISLIIKNPAVVDVSWPLCVAAAGLTFLYAHTMSVYTIALGAFTLCWCLRLSGYLLWSRVLPGYVNKRYSELSHKWKINKMFGFFFNYQLQAFFTLIVALPYLAIGHMGEHPATWLYYIGFILAILSLILECIADWQLEQFKLIQPKDVCNTGLWSYSRHPNYFFEWLLVLSLSIIGLQSWYGLLGLLGPIGLYIVMVYITGPITERGSLLSRGEDYAKYQKQVPMFFPKFIRKP
jgi:steroid 5-alpha reductase family enzyme